MSLELLKDKKTTALLLDGFGDIKYKQDCNMPEVIKTWFPATSCTNSGASFVCTGLNNRTLASVRAKLQLKITAVGSTYSSVARVSGSTTGKVGTGSSLINKNSATCDDFAVSKLIKSMTITPNGCVLQDNQRGNSEMVDIFAMQYDQEYMNNEFNIHPYHMTNKYQVSNAIPNCIHNSEIATALSTELTDLYGGNSRLPDWIKERNERYCKFTPVSASTTQSGVSLTYSETNGVLNILNGANTYYCNAMDGAANSNILTQVVNLEIDEYLQSRFLSNPYAGERGNMKVWNTSNGVLNLTLEFSQQYLSQIVKLYKPTGNGLQTSQPFISSVSVEVIGMQIELETFKPFPLRNINPSPRMIYYNQNAMTDQISSLTNSEFPATFNATNLVYLPRFLVLYAHSNLDLENSATKATRTNVFHEFKNVPSITMNGNQLDILKNFKSLNDLYVMTAECLRNPQFLNMLRGEKKEKYVYSAAGNAVWSQVALSYPSLSEFQAGGGSDSNGTAIPANFTHSLPFIIIDMCKCNLGEINGIPVIPNVDFGVPFSLKIEYIVKAWAEQTNVVKNLCPSGTQFIIRARAIFLQKYLGEMDYNGRGFSEKAVYFNMDEYRQAYEEMFNSAQIQPDEELLVAGGWFSDLKDSVVGLVKKIPSAVRTANNFLKEHGTFVPSAVRDGVNLAEKALDVVGLGKQSRGRGKYSKVSF